MANVRCQSCGRTVRLAGVAALCPHCGQLVSNQQFPTMPVQQAQPVEPLGADKGDFVADLLEREDLERRGPYKLYYIIGALVAGIVLLLAALAIVVGKLKQVTPAPPVAITPPPTSRPTSAPSTAGKGSEWFTESPSVPKPEPAPAPPPPTRPAAPPPPHSQLASIKPAPPEQLVRFVNDEQIGIGLKRGLDFLLSQFSGARLKDGDNNEGDMYQGRSALAVYAVLHCGQALSDPRVTRDSEMVKAMLERLKDFPMNGDKATYSRSLRISALTVYNRPQDKAAIEADVTWLLKSSKQGAYDYGMPQPEQKREN